MFIFLINESPYLITSFYMTFKIRSIGKKLIKTLEWLARSATHLMAIINRAKHPNQ